MSTATDTLAGAKLSGADLDGADLRGANLRGAAPDGAGTRLAMRAQAQAQVDAEYTAYRANKSSANS